MFIPVDVTTPIAVPLTTKVLLNKMLVLSDTPAYDVFFTVSTVLFTGLVSPVKEAYSNLQVIVFIEHILISAGTLSPYET